MATSLRLLVLQLLMDSGQLVEERMLITNGSM
jgi:hypothetical protein